MIQEENIQFPNGKLNRHDEGTTTISIGFEEKNNVVIIQFPKPLKWLGLSTNELELLLENLQGKLKIMKENDKLNKKGE